jgi:fluoroacetyl-CoA thioesterase
MRMNSSAGNIRAGIRSSIELHVDERLCVPALAERFAGMHDMPPVLATAFMVAFIEWAAIEALRGYLASGQKTVGTHIDVSHVAATPIGMTVTAEVEIVAVMGRTLRFRVRCNDESGLIGEGFHERTIIDGAKFLKRVAAKAENRHV